MQKPLRDLQINFEPPSDFVGESSSGGRKWFKWVGIGCAGITLVLALIMVFGGFKMVSCCSNLVETTKMTIVTEQFTQEFAEAIQHKDYETAYGATSVEHFQSGTSLDDFKAKFTPHEALIARSMPVVTNVSVLNAGTQEDPRWDVNVRLLPPDGNEMLTMKLEIGGRISKGDDSAASLKVFALEVDRRKRDLAAEEPAVAAVGFQELLSRGEYEAAYERFGREVVLGEEDADADKMNEEAFKAFVQEHDTVLTRKINDVVRVEYRGSNQASVVVRVGLFDGGSTMVTYRMVRSGSYSGWRVWEIVPEPEVVVAPEVEEAANDDVEIQDVEDADQAE